MSIHDYRISLEISKSDPTFASLIMAAMRKADSINMILLQKSFPEIFSEFNKRYWSPNGRLDSEIGVQLEE